MSEDYKAILEPLLTDESNLVRATLSGHRKSELPQWLRVTLRPVLIREQRHIQFTYYDAKRAVVKNYTAEEHDGRARELLELPFAHYYVETTERKVQVNITKRGKVITTVKPASQEKASCLAHDRPKNLRLPPQEHDPYLAAVGIMGADGRIKPSMYAKFRQVNEFLNLVAQLVRGDGSNEPPQYLVDLGCGNAYLTFALYHYWRNLAGAPIEIHGVDAREEPVRKNTQKASELGWHHMRFDVAKIAAFVPSRPPDVVLSLHACDTATDEAISQAIHWDSRFIFCVPCCHHDLQVQLAHQRRNGPLAAVHRDGILFELLGDVMTDTLRATILRIMGYHTDVVQFVTPEHTAKNLMIRAARTGTEGDATAIAEYKALTQFLPVVPRLATLLGARFAQFVE